MSLLQSRTLRLNSSCVAYQRTALVPPSTVEGPSKLLQEVTRLTYILEVPGLNVIQGTDYPD